MPLRWWLRMAVAPIAILLILSGLGWLAYAFSAPSDQQPITIRAEVMGFRLEDVGRLRGGNQVLVVVALRDGRQAMVRVEQGAVSLCRVGGTITLNQYTDHVGYGFLRAGAHPCG